MVRIIANENELRAFCSALGFLLVLAFVSEDVGNELAVCEWENGLYLCAFCDGYIVS